MLPRNAGSGEVVDKLALSPETTDIARDRALPRSARTKSALDALSTFTTADEKFATVVEAITTTFPEIEAGISALRGKLALALMEEQRLTTRNDLKVTDQRAANALTQVRAIQESALALAQIMTDISTHAADVLTLAEERGAVEEVAAK